MKKFFIMALALLFVAGFAYAAEEEMTLDERVAALENSSSMFEAFGQYRAEFYNVSNAGFDGKGENEDGDGKDSTNLMYVDQRFRAGFNWMPADGVKATLRGDFTEGNWDYDYRPGSGNGRIMIDNAFVDLTPMEMLNLRIGLQGWELGKGIAAGYQGAAVKATGNFEPVSVTALWMKVDEGSGTGDDSKGVDEPDGFAGLDDDNLAQDEDFYGLQVVYNAEMFSAGGLYATKQDKNGGRGENPGLNFQGRDFSEADLPTEFDWQESTVNAIELFGSGSVGKISFWGAFTQFSGEGKDLVFSTGPDAGVAEEAIDVDFVGQQLALNGQMGVNEQLTVGLDLFYAAAYDGDDEVQVTTVYDDDGYIPLDHGPFKWVYSNGLDVFMVDQNAGGQGLNLYGTFMPMEALTLYGNVGYSKATDEDPYDTDSYVSSFTVVSVAASYAFLPGSSFSLKYENVSRDVTNPSGLDEEDDGYLHDDAISQISAMVKVSF
jgi:hypothetical protein